MAVYTGRLLRGKGLEVLIEAFSAVAAERVDLQLLLVGSGDGQSLSVEPELRRRVSELGLAARVLFAGRRDRVEDWLRAADLFVFPSLYEALGISLVEAAACGLPAIGSRTGGIVDVIEDDSSGLLVPPGDARSARAGPAGARDGWRAPPGDGRPRALAGARAFRRAGLARPLPRALRRDQPSTSLRVPAGRCSSCRWRSSSITGRSSLKEK